MAKLFLPANNTFKPSEALLMKSFCNLHAPPGSGTCLQSAGTRLIADWLPQQSISCYPVYGSWWRVSNHTLLIFICEWIRSVLLWYNRRVDRQLYIGGEERTHSSRMCLQKYNYLQDYFSGVLFPNMKILVSTTIIWKSFSFVLSIGMK